MMLSKALIGLIGVLMFISRFRQGLNFNYGLNLFTLLTLVSTLDNILIFNVHSFR